MSDEVLKAPLPIHIHVLISSSTSGFTSDLEVKILKVWVWAYLLLSFPTLYCLFPRKLWSCILLMIKQLKCCPYFIAPDTLITVWKVSKCRVFSGPFFPYSRIRKTRTIKNSVFGQLSRSGCSFTFCKVE